MKKWSDIRRQWESDPENERTFQDEFPYELLANEVIALRMRYGLTQENLAEKAGTTQSVIARLESGKHPVRVEMLTRIADGVGLTWKPSFSDPLISAYLDSARIAIETPEPQEKSDAGNTSYAVAA
jgi:transcriptional regulator with XRE-family HTH domain